IGSGGTLHPGERSADTMVSGRARGRSIDVCLPERIRVARSAGHRQLSVTAVVMAAAISAVTIPPGPPEATTPSPYGFNKPRAIAVNAGNLWIANYGGNSVTEMTPSGTLIRTISGTQYGFSWPISIVSYYTAIFVVNYGGSVTELNASTG